MFFSEILNITDRGTYTIDFSNYDSYVGTTDSILLDGQLLSCSRYFTDNEIFELILFNGQENELRLFSQVRYLGFFDIYTQVCSLINETIEAELIYSDYSQTVTFQKSNGINYSLVSKIDICNPIFYNGDKIDIDSNLYSALKLDLGLSEDQIITSSLAENVHILFTGTDGGAPYYYNQENIFSFLSVVNLEELVFYFKNIRHLNLTNIDDLQMFDSISSLENLEQINMSSNSISDISSLSNLTSLTELSLSYNLISDISSLSNLTNLTELSLSFNSISDISSLSNLNNLTLLNLSYNSISDISSLGSLTNLERLYLSNNQLTEEQIEELRNLLPNCIIIN